MSTTNITNDICQISGTYKVTIGHAPFDKRHPRYVDVKKGEKFPSCSKCNKHVKYKLFKEI